MCRLLIQSCCATKRSVEHPVPAIDLYDGYFYRIIDKARRTDRFDQDIDMLILSAEHGILEPDEKITPYDRRMDRQRALELQNHVQSTVADCAADSYDQVWINGAKAYRLALDGLEERLDVPVRAIDGNGIGEKGRKLKQLITVE